MCRATLLRNRKTFQSQRDAVELGGSVNLGRTASNMASWDLFPVVVLCWTFMFSKVLGTYNVDPAFSRWPTKSAIPYYMDTSYYTPTEQGWIRAGITKIMADLQGCVTFVETTASDTRFKIFITPYNDAGVLQTFCYSYQGQVNSLVNTGAPFQRMNIVRGTPYGCLDGTLHNIMKYFAIVLGKRNEHQRGDRETYINVINANIAVPNSYRLYNDSEARWALFPYDFCSITHNRITDYSTPGTNAFTIPATSGPGGVPFLDTISQSDCQLLSMIYNCPASACPTLDCNAARQSALATTTAAPITSTTPLPTTTSTSCPTNYFCTHKTDESSYLLGPYQLYQTLLMYSGPCVMEYTFDWNTVLLTPSNPPVPVTTYFPSPGGPTAVTPVDLAYMQLDPNGAQLLLTVANSAAATGLTCSTDPSVPTNAATCPTAAAASATLATALSKVSSVTTQINLQIGDIYQYVVVKPGNNEIALMNADFTMTYATSSGFLSNGGSPMVAITALQILQDQSAVNNDVLAVFGTDAGGNPLVGFVDLLLTADPLLPIAPWTWLQSPVPIAQYMSKYCP